MLSNANYDVILPNWEVIRQGVSTLIITDQTQWLNSIKGMLKMILTILEAKPKLLSQNLEINTAKWSADSRPVNWISKWFNCCTTHGFGYKMNDTTVGALFPDMTNLIQRPSAPHILKLHYLNRSGGGRHVRNVGVHSIDLIEKVKVLRSFKNYMNDNLSSTVAKNMPVVKSLSRAPIVHLYLWLETNLGTVMHLSNGSLQINYLDHTKIILSLEKQKIMFFDDKYNLYSYSSQTIMENGWSRALFKRIVHVKELLLAMMKMFG